MANPLLNGWLLQRNSMAASAQKRKQRREKTRSGSPEIPGRNQRCVGAADRGPPDHHQTVSASGRSERPLDHPPPQDHAPEYRKSKGEGRRGAGHCGDSAGGDPTKATSGSSTGSTGAALGLACWREKRRESLSIFRMTAPLQSVICCSASGERLINHP